MCLYASLFKRVQIIHVSASFLTQIESFQYALFKMHHSSKSTAICRPWFSVCDPNHLSVLSALDLSTDFHTLDYNIYICLPPCDFVTFGLQHGHEMVRSVLFEWPHSVCDNLKYDINIYHRDVLGVTRCVLELLLFAIYVQPLGPVIFQNKHLHVCSSNIRQQVH